MQIESQVIQVNLDDIIPNRFQPRIAFDEKGLQELSASIKEHGIIQPLVLRKLGNKYEIIAGERRYKAATMAGLTTVPAVISNIDDNKSAEVALVENIQRRDLTPIEEARSYKNLLDKGYLTQEELAKKMGLSQSAIANKLRLLNLDETVQQALLDGKISERHARSLLSIENKEEQKEWLNKIISERLTVRQLDQELKKMASTQLSSGDVPLVDVNPNIEQIKNNAKDINKNSNNNVASMLVPEETMIEYDDQLNPIKQPVETIINNQPVVETPSKEIEPQQDTSANKFFETLYDDKSPVDNYSIDSLFNPNIKTDNEVEVFDMPMTPEVEQNKPAETQQQNIDLNLSPNNKFFQSYSESDIDILDDNKTVENNESTLVNPMDYIEQTVPANDNSAIKSIKDFLMNLQTQGVKLKFVESDSDNIHNINIEIEK